MAEIKEEFTPRDYQIDLYAKALKGNVILYLPTGSGKTYIAIMLIKALSADIRKPWDEGGKRTIFAVNTVPLVNQQCAYVSRHTDLICSGYSGDMNIDFSVKDRWNVELKKNQVLVMTSQILLDLLNHSLLPLSRINLIIFDECHHAVGDHPMRRIMKIYEHYDTTEHPKILGLSATLLNCNVRVDEVGEAVRNLEKTFHATVVSVDRIAAVSGYGKPHETNLIYDAPVITAVSIELLNMIDSAIQILSMVDVADTAYNESSRIFQPIKKTIKLKNIFEEMKIHISTFGLYVGNLGISYHLVQIARLKNFTNDKQLLIVLDYLTTLMMTMQKIINDKLTESTELETMMIHSTDKIIKLFNVLKDSYDKILSLDQSFHCIIFVQRRFTAKILYHVLKKLSELHEDFKFLIPEYVLGNNSSPFKNPVENMSLGRRNAEGLKKFRLGKVNCLIATQVLEEGVDIPQCSLVINFDAPQDFRSYVQGRGRARYEKSHFVIFVENGDTRFNSRYNEFQNVESMLKDHLVENAVERCEPLPEEIQDFLYSHEIKPYIVTDKQGVVSQITEVSAIPLLNKYCAKLPQPQFVISAPIYKLCRVNKSMKNTKEKGNYLVSIRLPLFSPLKDIIYGDAMPSVVSAKRSTAMAACIKLHEIGELTDKLLPRECYKVIDNFTHNSVF